ncbi:hypothetical protein [Actinokineospora sp. NBRC 105648]|uniref:hypothetical protein n=1 Tax=Actinokineospora sp. NBRC 105648 TaxID=3032206 RepID=UPI0024A3E4B9|nr:hypothetical protein [Actinokineospora sp. NBRC 105648]GLZ42883.1 hypothetical protein Acsp05_65070 [Actinokineospora sp. NBRC 105648]
MRTTPVPYIATWSEEDIPYPHVVTRPDGRGIGYADESILDRDTRGVLWDRATGRPGGRPQFARIHPLRQRRTMLRLLCQVCASPADRDDDGVLWVLWNRTTDWPDWPERALVSEPPICLPCLDHALRLCPALREGHFIIRARSYDLYGVDGLPYSPAFPRPVPRDREIVPFSSPVIAWTLASKLARRLGDCTVITALT